MSSKTGDCLISYDIDRNHVTVKSAMKTLGYMDRVTVGGNTYALPNTTLWKNQTSTDTALSDLQRICRQTGTTLEKAITVLGTEWLGV